MMASQAINIQSNADQLLSGPVGQVYDLVVGNELLFAGTQVTYFTFCRSSCFLSMLCEHMLSCFMFQQQFELYGLCSRLPYLICSNPELFLLSEFI